MTTKTVTVRIHGRVQGVWYRGWTVQEASRRGLTGWVRNRRDGSVEALFHGPTEKVEAMVDLCRRGPPAARVDTLRLTPVAAPPGEENGFRQEPTL